MCRVSEQSFNPISVWLLSHVTISELCFQLNEQNSAPLSKIKCPEVQLLGIRLGYVALARYDKKNCNIRNRKREKVVQWSGQQLEELRNATSSSSGEAFVEYWQRLKTNERRRENLARTSTHFNCFLIAERRGKTFLMCASFTAVHAVWVFLFFAVAGQKVSKRSPSVGGGVVLANWFQFGWKIVMSVKRHT